MLKVHNPGEIAAPFSRYSQGIEVPANSRWLHVSGQVGARPDGTLEKGFEAQARRSWSNLVAVLHAAGMGVSDLVKVNVFLTRREDIPASRAVRDEVLVGAQPASTLVIVSGLAHPDLLIEIEAVAARAPEAPPG